MAAANSSITRAAKSSGSFAERRHSTDPEMSGEEIAREHFERGLYEIKPLKELESLLASLTHEQITKEYENTSETLLHAACAAGAPIEIIEKLVVLHPEALGTKSSITGCTPLHYACNRPFSVYTKTLIRLLLEKCPEIRYVQDRDGDTPLYLACLKGAPRYALSPLVDDLYQELLNCSHFDNDGECSDDGNTPLHMICANLNSQNLGFLEFAIQQKALSLQLNRDLQTPLHLLCSSIDWRKQNHRGGFKQSKVKHNVKSNDYHAYDDCDERTPDFNQMVLKILESWIATCAEILHMVDSNGNTPLHLLCRPSSINNKPPEEVIRLFATKFPELLAVKNKAGKTPLHLAIKDNKNDFLFQLGTTNFIGGALCVADNEGKTILHNLADVCFRQKELSSVSSQDFVVRLKSFIAPCPALLRCCIDFEGNTFLHCLSRGIDMRAEHSSCFALIVECVKLAVNTYPLSLAVANWIGDNPLHLACRFRRGRLWHILIPLVIEHTPSILPVTDGIGSNVLHALFQEDYEQLTCHDDLRTVEQMIFACPELCTATDHEGNTPLHLAFSILTKRLPTDIILLLVQEHPSLLSMSNEEGNTPLNCAFRHSNTSSVIDFVLSLVSQNCPSILLKQNKKGQNCLHLLFGFSDLSDALFGAVKSIVELSPSILCSTDISGNNPLHILCRRFWCQDGCVLGNEINNGNNRCRDEMLHFVAKLAVELCSDALCMSNMQKDNIFHILFNLMEISADLIPTVDLIAARWTCMLSNKDSFGNTPLHLLCRRTTAPFELIQLVARLNCKALTTPNNAGNSPLHLVCGAVDILNYVIPIAIEQCPEALATLNKAQRNVLHVLFLRSEILDTDIRWVESMARRSPGILGDRDCNGCTPLHIICSVGGRDTSGEILNLLIDLYPDALAMADLRGNTPIHLACRHVRWPGVAVLIRHAQERCSHALGATNSNNSTPLHLLCSLRTLRSEEGLELVQTVASHSPASLGRIDKEGFTPLHFACFRRSHLRSTVRYMLERWPVASLLLSHGGRSVCKHVLNRARHLSVPVDEFTAQREDDLLFISRLMSDTLAALVMIAYNDLCAVPSIVIAYLTRCVPEMSRLEDSNNAILSVLALRSHFAGPDSIEKLESFISNDSLQVYLKQGHAQRLICGIVKILESGGDYIESDPGNKRKGVHVLASVSDNIDALFFHLRQNPSLSEIHKSDAALRKTSLVLFITEESTRNVESQLRTKRVAVFQEPDSAKRRKG